MRLIEVEPGKWRIYRAKPKPKRSDLPLPYVISDSMPPTEQVDGKFYTSKRAFRAVGRALGLTEVGNEKPKPRQRASTTTAARQARRPASRPPSTSCGPHRSIPICQTSPLPPRAARLRLRPRHPLTKSDQPEPDLEPEPDRLAGAPGADRRRQGIRAPPTKPQGGHCSCVRARQRAAKGAPERHAPKPAPKAAEAKPGHNQPPEATGEVRPQEAAERADRPD
jgi:hypothetical protein